VKRAKTSGEKLEGLSKNIRPLSRKKLKKREVVLLFYILAIL